MRNSRKRLCGLPNFPATHSLRWEQIFILDNRNYLITVDYLSNFSELYYLPDTRSTTVIPKLKAHFARHGITDVISDNGPQYSLEEFKRFSRQWEFKQDIITSLPAEQWDGRIGSKDHKTTAEKGKN